MDDFERMRRQWERLSKDLAPSLELLRELDRKYDWAKLQREIMPTTLAAQEYFESLRRFTEPKYFTDLADLVARNQLDLDKLLTFNLSVYRDESAAGLRTLQTLKALAGSAALSSAASEFIERVTDNSLTSIGEKESSAGEVEDEYLKVATRLPLTPATAQFILSVLLTLLLFWLSQKSAEGSEERILDRIGQVESAIEEAVAVLQSGEDRIEFEPPKRAVLRSTVVLTKPGGRSGRALGLLYADQVVVVKTARGKWCEIEWFDLRDRSLKLGWVRKKYLGRPRK